MIAPGVPVEDIDESHLRALITEAVAEKRTVEYKSELPGGNDDARKEFLADVSSFANASGGDLIYGIKAEDGVPVEISPLLINPDQERLTWEQVIRTGVQPRILGTVVRDIPVEGGHALLLRIPRSFVGPHAVTYKGSHSLRFYSRTSAGKYPLDVAEVRSAFLNASGLSEAIRNFQTDRLGEILAGGYSTRFLDTPKIVVHLVPLTAFANESTVDLSLALEMPWLAPLGQMVGNHPRWNIDGLITTAQEGDSPEFVRVYAQLFRNGIYEGVDCVTLRPHENLRHGAPPHVFGRWFENVIQQLHAVLALQERIGAASPIVCLVAIVGGRGLLVAGNQIDWISEWIGLDRDVVILPDVTLGTINLDAAQIMQSLRPVIDGFWQATGRPTSPNYNAEGIYDPDRRSLSG